MKEHSSRKVNVLGTDVSVMRAEKAVNLTMDYMRRKGLEVVFFHSAESSLYCQNQPGAAEIIGNCQLVLPGDSHVEMAVRHQRNDSEDRKGIGEFADEYLKRLFAKLNRESREIYAVMEKQEHLDSLKEETRTMIFHEAPHKLRTTLDDLTAAFGPERRISLCREMTKLHEEVIRCTLAEAAAYYQENTPKGEYVLVVAGAAPKTGAAVTLEDGVAQVLALKAQGIRLKDAAKEVAEHTGLSKNELYAAALEK